MVVVLAAVLFVPWLWGWIAGSSRFPELTGAYAVGFRRLSVSDPSREEIFSAAEGDLRELMVSVYYPAAADAQGGPGRYGDAREIRKAGGAPAFLAAPLRPRRVADAPPFAGGAGVGKAGAGGRFPVLLFSPGMEGPVLFYAGLLEQVASHGYIVVAVDHPYTTGVVTFADGLADLAPLADLGRIGVFGHSFGGRTAAATLKVDPRFGVGLDFDGSIVYRPVLEQGVEQPFALVCDDFDPPYDYLADKGDGVRAWFGRWEGRNRPPAVAEASRDFRTYQVEGLAHEGFVTDFLILRRILPLLVGRDLVGTSRAEQVIPALTDLVVAWFCLHLRGKHSDLLEDPSGVHAVLRQGIDTSEWSWD